MYPRAKKSFGQHWLVDETVVRKMIEAAEIEPGETVVEVGPGTGVLTQGLVDAGASVIAVEADRSLIPALRKRFGDKIILIHNNVLSIFPSRFTLHASRFTLHASRYKLIANIPYNITSDFLRRFLTITPRPTRMVVMMQKEVADRITAAPPNMGLLSVVCQLYARCRRIARVPAGAFHPIPKVDSVIVRFDIIVPVETWGIDSEAVIRLAKHGFASRRKQLHRNLSGVRGFTSGYIQTALESMGLDPRIRAQDLSVENWITLYKALGP